MANKDRVLVGKKYNSTLNVYRYPAKPKKPIEPKARKAMKPVADKRRKQNAEYSVVRVEFLTDNPVCQIQVEGCTHEATEVHHKKGRIDKLLTNKEFFCAACSSCHHWAEMNPDEAKEKGVSISRLKK